MPQNLVQPLKVMRINQPFGVDWTGVNLYRRLGLKAHNGLDLRAPTGTEVFACMDGIAAVEISAPPGTPIEGYNSGYGVNIRIRSKALGLEAVYGHLQATLVNDREPVKAGQLIAKADNTGISSGSHLHFGIRRISYRADGAGPFILDQDNGYLGYIDPLPLLADGVFDLPVDRGYGLAPAKSELAWYVDAAYFWRTVGRLPTTREKKALLYGRWDLRTVLDDAMFPIWSEMSKPAAIDRGFVKAR